MEKLGYKNDAASSIKVEGKNCEVYVYEHYRYQGKKAIFEEGSFPDIGS